MAEETPEQKAAREAAEAAAQKKFEGLDPETQKFVKDLREEAKNYRLELQSLKSVKTELDTLKQQQAAAEAAKLAAQGEHQKLADQYKKELDSLKPELDRLKAVEQARHKTLLDKLPEEAREKYKAITTDVLEDIVTRFLGEQHKDPLPGKKPGATENDKKFEDYGPDDLDELRRTDMVKYRKLLNDYSMRKNGRPAVFAT